MRRPHTSALPLLALLALSACAPAGPRPDSAAAPGPNAAATGVAATAATQGEASAALVRQSAKVLRELRAQTPHAMLDAAIEDARALIVLPGVYQAGLIYSVQGGSGVLLARRADGGWGAPVFVATAGVGYGLQAGVERTRVVLAIMDEEVLLRMLQNGLSFDAAAKYDILGVREETGPNSLTTGRPVQVFGDGAGMMAGIAFRGGLITLDEGRSSTYHAGVAARQAMRGSDAPGMEVFELWSAVGVAPRGPEIIRAK